MKLNNLVFISLMTGLLPIIAIHCTYLVSATGGYVPWCIPYFESCASISATGRHGAAFYLFKGTMIPAAMLLMLYWYLAGMWLIQMGDSRMTARVIFVLGMLGGVFLIVYTVALGAAGDDFRLQRRIGIIFYFTFTYLCQLLLVWRMHVHGIDDSTRNWLLALVVTALALGLSTVVLDVLLDNYDAYEDAFEWILALVIHLFFLVTASTWARTSFRVRFEGR